MSAEDLPNTRGDAAGRTKSMRCDLLKEISRIPVVSDWLLPSLDCRRDNQRASEKQLRNAFSVELTAVLVGMGATPLSHVWRCLLVPIYGEGHWILGHVR
mmetsp:Transcript_16295/g.40152  ORF Transcript_16295/g.40152 Transcript_16295/m.40152 type:complete len:100 (-) Transcript_16295:471-770(-)